MLEAREPKTGEVRRARTLEGLARQVGGKSATYEIGHTDEFRPQWRRVRILRRDRQNPNSYHVLSTWIVYGLGVSE